MKILLITLLITSCTYFKTVDSRKPDPNERVGELQEKYNAILALSLEEFEPVTGWPSIEDCDGTLWAGEGLAGGATNIDIELAEYNPGEIHRRPIMPCYDNGDLGAKSTVSNDMIRGYTWGLWATNNLAAAQRLADFGEKNNWVMGQPPTESTVNMSINNKGILGRMLYTLSDGKDDRSYRKDFSFYVPVFSDFEEHLQVLGILLEGEINESLEAKSLDATVNEPQEGLPLELVKIREQFAERLKALANQRPDDALFQAANGVYTGNFDRAIDLLLLDETPVPSYVRGADSYPLVHWLFAAKIVLKRFEK